MNSALTAIGGTYPDPRVAGRTLDQVHTALAPYMLEATSLVSVNETTAPKTLSTLLEGLMVAGTYVAAAQLKFTEARLARKNAEAISALDRFPSWCETTKTKPTADIRAAFVDLDSDVQRAALEEAYAQALVEQISSIKMAITMALSSAKAIVYGYRDSSSVGGSKMG